MQKGDKKKPRRQKNQTVLVLKERQVAIASEANVSFQGWLSQTECDDEQQFSSCLILRREKSGFGDDHEDSEEKRSAAEERRRHSTCL